MALIKKLELVVAYTHSSVVKHGSRKTFTLWECGGQRARKCGGKGFDPPLLHQQLQAQSLNGKLTVSTSPDGAERLANSTEVISGVDEDRESSSDVVLAVPAFK